MGESAHDAERAREKDRGLGVASESRQAGAEVRSAAAGLERESAGIGSGARGAGSVRIDAVAAHGFSGGAALKAHAAPPAVGSEVSLPRIG